MIDYKKQGKRNRQAGARFELKVRSDLESKGWIVDRWTNNVEFLDGLSVSAEKGKEIEVNRFHMKARLIKAKSFMGRSRTNGFPDFIMFGKNMIDDTEIIPIHWNKKIEEIEFPEDGIYGVECKSNGYLDKIEKEKCKWLIDNNIFSKILIASKGKKRGEIEYKEFS